MTKPFIPLWRELDTRRRPGAATAESDAESGTEPASIRQELRALKVMRDRGAMSENDYRVRKEALLASVRPAGGR